MKDYDALKQQGKVVNDDDNLGCWGHEYVRSLAGEISKEYNVRVINGADPESDAEAEAVDLLIEVQRLEKLKDLDSIDDKNFGRICLYLIKTADYMSDPDDLAVSAY
jgi:26S proteasome regulatory subunit N1